MKFIWEFERRPFTKISLETYLRHIQKLGWEFEKRLSGAEDDEIKFNSTFLKQMIDQLYTVPDEFDEIQKVSYYFVTLKSALSRKKGLLLVNFYIANRGTDTKPDSYRART